MPSQFENAGLGNFGREGQFTRGGPINELVKLLPAFGAAYGLVKSGAVDKLNADNWLSNPRKSMSNAIFGSAPPTDTGKNGISLGGIAPNETLSPNGALATAEKPMSEQESRVTNWNPDAATASNPAQISASETPTQFSSEEATSSPVNLSNTHQSNLNAAHEMFPVTTEDPLKVNQNNQAADSNAVMANEYASPNRNVGVNPAGNPGGGSDIGAQIGLSLLSKFLAL